MKFVMTTVMQTGAVSAAAGSAYAEFGQTKVIVSVYVSLVQIGQEF